ncbi:hypothetical protein TNCV_3684201 [Trichonephila clavipes]|uniref:Uncharacterized protein n=1 Tax=Trichonephila clavipes TaxID=2585209 RepID=A0A8X6V156_TRICX|nr:hypothetical protein TNCV_3684201 [Trichonephila clavipes]
MRRVSRLSKSVCIASTRIISPAVSFGYSVAQGTGEELYELALLPLSNLQLRRPERVRQLRIENTSAIAVRPTQLCLASILSPNRVIIIPVTINEGTIKSKLYAKPVLSVYITKINSLSERTNLSKPWIPVLQRHRHSSSLVLQRHRRSSSLISFGSNLYPPPFKSLFFQGSPSVS